MHKGLHDFVLLSVLCLAGCAPVLIGSGIAGGIVWERGKIQDTIDEPVPIVRKAAVRAVEKLGLSVRSDSGDRVSVRLICKMADERVVWIDIKALGKGGSARIKIRVGAFGDRAASERILTEIKGQLPR